MAGSDHQGEGCDGTPAVLKPARENAPTAATKRKTGRFEADALVSVVRTGEDRLRVLLVDQLSTGPDGDRALYHASRVPGSARRQGHGDHGPAALPGMADPEPRTPAMVRRETLNGVTVVRAAHYVPPRRTRLDGPHTRGPSD